MGDMDKNYENGTKPTGMPVLSLFSGAGGLDLGFEKAGFSPLLALDIDPAAVATHNWNRVHTSEIARVADLSDIPPETLLQWWKEQAGASTRPVGVIGGPPCQSFSVSNVHRIDNDPRARLPLAYAAILKTFNDAYKPAFFLFENVAGLGNKPHSSSLEVFRRSFEDAGFEVTPFYLDAADFGVPQYRRRMFFMGFNRSLYPGIEYVPPVGTSELVTVRQAIGHLPEPVRFARGANAAEFEVHPNHWCLNPKSPKFTNGSLKPGQMLGRSFRMLTWDDRSWTVAYGHREVHVHPKGHRRLSIYEAMLLQGFPSNYELRGTLSDQIRLVSDAVPPPLAEALANSIWQTLAGYSPSENADVQYSTNGHSTQTGFLGLQTVAPRSMSE